MITQDDVQQIRKDVAAIQEAIQSVVARLDAVSPQADAGINPVVTALSAEDEAHQNISVASVLSAVNEKRQQEIIAGGTGWDACRFARYVPGADIQALQQVVLERGDGGDACYFAWEIKGADLSALHKRLVSLHSTEDDIDPYGESYLDMFYRDTFEKYLEKNVNTPHELTSSQAALSAEDAQQHQEILESGSGWDAYQFARDTPGADIQALQQVILDRGNGRDVYWFAREVRGADIQALQQTVLERGDGLDIYEFALNIDGIDLQIAHKRLIELHSAGKDINSETGEKNYLKRFNEDPDIQGRLKSQLDVLGQFEPEGNASRKKHRPS